MAVSEEITNENFDFGKGILVAVAIFKGESLMNAG